MQRHYELAFLVDTDQAAPAHELEERYTAMITGAGGTVHRREQWGRRNLAYPIRKRQKAFYVLMNIECDTPTRDELQQLMRLNDTVLRHLLIRRLAADTEPSHLARQRKEGGTREPSAEQPAEQPADGADDPLNGGGTLPDPGADNDNANGAGEEGARTENRNLNGSA